jgi:hypothetical protein
MKLAVLIYGHNMIRYRVGRYTDEQGHLCVSFVSLPPGSERYVIREIPRDILVTQALFDEIGSLFDIEQFTLYDIGSSGKLQPLMPNEPIPRQQ